MKRLAQLFFAVVFLSATPTFAPRAGAQSVEQFYKGKQIQFFIRAAPGGNYDSYSRLLGIYLTRWLPGHPTVVPINMPGGGGLVALNYLANVAPKDGTALTIVTQTLPMDQALNLDPTLKVDLRSLNWIGEMSDSNELSITGQSSPTRTLDDAKRRVTPMAATGKASSESLLAAIYNKYLGTKFKLIYGYPSGPDMSLAMQRGEVEGRSVSNLQELGPDYATASRQYHFLIQAGMKKVPGYEAVPLLRDLAVTDQERRIFDFVSEAIVIARPVATNAGVPADRVAALRLAFDEATHDQGFIAEAARQGLQASSKSGRDLQAEILDVIDAPLALRTEAAQAAQFPDAPDDGKARPIQ